MKTVGEWVDMVKYSIRMRERGMIFFGQTESVPFGIHISRGARLGK